MWLYLVGLLLVLFGIAGVIVGGGPALVLVPLGLIVGIGSAIMRRRRAAAAGGSIEPSQDEEVAQSLPTSLPSDSGHVPTSPEGLTDARRMHQ